MPDLIPWWQMLPQAQTPEQTINAQLLNEKLTQAKGITQGANAFGNLYKNPANIDARGNLTPQAMQRLMQTSPLFGLDVMSKQAEMARTQAEIARANMTSRVNGEKLIGDESGRLLTEFEPLLAKYDADVKQYGPEVARRRGQEEYSKLVERARSSGSYLPEVTRDIRPDFDPDRLRANLLGYKGLVEKQGKERQEVREERRVSNEEVRLNRESAAEPKLYEVPKEGGGTEQKMLRYDKDKRIYVDQDTGKEVKPIRPIATRELGGDNAALPPETLHSLAEQYIAGDRSVMQNIGRGAQGSKNIVALRSEIARQMAERGMSGADMAAKMAEYDGMKAGMRTLGTRTANVEMAVSEAQQLAPLVLDASNKVNRTQFPLLNKVIQAGESGTGDEDVVRFGIAVNSLINTYARAINPTGVSRVSDLEHARELLSTAWSKGQINSAVDQLMKEMTAARQSPGLVRKEMSDAVAGKGGMPGREGAAPAGGGAEAPIPPAQAGKLPPMKDGVYALRKDSAEADYDALPSGATFVGPDGKRRVKP